MAFCPNCTKEIPMMAQSCEHCGYDFPDKTEDKRIFRITMDWAYGGFATAAIIAVQIVCALGVLLCLIEAATVLLDQRWIDTLLCLLNAFLAFGLLAAFTRVQDLR